MDELIDDDWREWRVSNSFTAPTPPDDATWGRVYDYLERSGQRSIRRWPQPPMGHEPHEKI